MAGSVVDTAYELRRELKAETNKPGYKTEPVRKAIQAGVAITGNALKAAQEQAKLAAAKRRTLRLQAAKQDKLLEELVNERTRVLNNLKRCIADPATTWLQPAVVEAVNDQSELFGGSGMRDAVKKMILARNEIQKQEEEIKTAEAALEDLKTAIILVEDVCSYSKAVVSEAVANSLRNELYGLFESTEELPLILRLDEMEERLAELKTVAEEKIPEQPTFYVGESATTGAVKEPEIPLTMVDSGEDDLLEATPFFAADAEVEEPTTVQTTILEEPARMQTAVMEKPEAVEATVMDATEIVPEIVDVIPDAIIEEEVAEFIPGESTKSVDFQNVAFDSEVDAVEAGLVAEIVTDDDFHTALGEPKAAAVVTEGEEEKEDNPLLMLTLRFFDVIFFLLEKILVGVPKAILIGNTAMSRFAEVNRDGRGKAGWQQFEKLDNTKGRY
jgi:hypothetical protein